MRKKFAQIAVAVIVAVFGVIVPMTVPANAADEPATGGGFGDICDEDLAGSDVCQPVNDERNLMTVVQGIINTVLSMIGIIAVIIIIVAGQRMTTSAGDPGKLKAAKDMMIWGIVGVIIALLAFAIVNFVVMVVPAG